ncbi:Helix-turn-helix domain-containing protein [Paenibacillus sp. 1_12]|uniref:helix-turn-helix domain-containing protein n=1 Tax=Paenibacillus sp. 1_12 TaxID=1566278 RepID=UPI0008E61EFC|nr:helix-turn-helix domain-containing protein [Paenibacillus sp. 1_12]SFM30622.1 Helix-turn-helix domain-containing protein [Paenibacillus sp. 1_12]
MRVLPTFWKLLLFKKKLFMYSVVVGFVPVVLSSIIFYSLWKESVTKEFEDHFHNDLIHMQSRLDSVLGELNLASVSLASNSAAYKIIAQENESTSQIPLTEWFEAVRNLKHLSSIYYDVSLINNKTFQIHTTSGRQFSYFDNMIERKLSYNDSLQFVYPNSHPNQDELLLFRPVPFRTLLTDGAVILHVSIRELQNISDRLKFEPTQKLWVINSVGKILLSPSNEDIGTTLPEDSLQYSFWKNTAMQQPIQYGGENQYVSSIKSASTGYTIIIMTPAEQLTEKMEYIKIVAALFTVILLLLWLLISDIGSQRLYRPIEQLLDKCKIKDIYDLKHNDELEALNHYISQILTTNHDMQDQLTKYLPDLKLSIFQHLLWGELTESELQSKIEQLNLPLKGEFFYICVAVIDDYTKFINMYNKSDQLLIHKTLRNMAIEAFEEKVTCATFTPRHGQIVILIGTDKTMDNRDPVVRTLTENFRASVRDEFPFTLSISISKARRGYASMSLSFHEAISMLNYKLLLGNDVTVSEQQLESSIRTSNPAIFQLQKQIVRSLIQGNMDEASRHLTLLIETVPKHVFNSRTALGIFSNLLGELEYLIHEMALDINDIFQEDLYDTLYGKSTLEDIQIWLIETVFPTIKEQMENQYVSKQKRLVQQVISYIHDLYDNDLTLQQIADQLSISPSQLSRIFKEETDRNFSEYLIEYRMKKSIDLLENSDISIKVISEKMRYTNVQNFSRIFKQFTGVPPGEYRKQSRDSS